MKTPKTVLLALSIFCGVEGQSLADSPAARTECTITRIAERYITVHYPDFDSIRSPPIIRDKGQIWEVEYELPVTMIGGTPVVLIEKSGLKVLRSFMTR